MGRKIQGDLNRYLMRTRHFASHRACVYVGLEIHNSPIRREVSSAALAEQQSFKFDPSTVSLLPIAADLGCTQFK